MPTEPFLSELFEEDPVLASSLGVEGYDDRLGDFSAEGFRRRADRERAWLTRFEAVPEQQLDLDERIDRGLALAFLRGQAVMHDWERWRRDPAIYVEPALNGALTVLVNRTGPDSEVAQAMAARLHRVGAVLDDGMANLEPELVGPVLARRALTQSEGASRYLAHDVPKEFGGPAAQKLAEAGGAAASAYERFAAFLAPLADTGGGTHAIGEDRYSGLLCQRELLRGDARTVVEEGSETFQQLQAELATRSRRLWGADDWRVTREQLRKEHAGSLDDLRRAYVGCAAAARQFVLDRGLVDLPSAEQCLVESSPRFQRAVLAVPFYWRPPVFSSSRRGHLFIPYPPDGASAPEVAARLEANGRHSVAAIAVHETYPGHHWQALALQANPRPIRKVLVSSFFIEGWGVYAEQLMREQGFMTEAEEFCQIAARLLRAVRMVVDVGLHTGELTVEQAQALLRDEAGLPPVVAEAEVARYCAWPTQAVSYLAGAQEIERLRDVYRPETGADLRRFHQRLAASGAPPIRLAARALEQMAVSAPLVH